MPAMERRVGAVTVAPCPIVKFEVEAFARNVFVLEPAKVTCAKALVFVAMPEMV